MFKMKRYLALLLAVLMLISIAGCGGSKDPTEAPSNESDPPKETAGTPESSATDPIEMDENLTVHENTFFTVGYKEEDGWTLAEDDIYMSEYGGNIDLRILDADGYTDVLVEVDAYEEDASSFRESLHNYGIDLKAYAEGTWVTENIGGERMAYVDTEYGERCFFSRNEAAGVSYEISASDWTDARVLALVENIFFTAPGTDNMDPPWPWEGVRISGGRLSQMVGTYNLTAEFLPMGEALTTFETFDHDIAVVGDNVYLLSDSVLYQFAYDGSSLSFIKEIALPGEYDIVEKGAGESIILSAFMEPVIGHDGASDQPAFSYEGPDNFSVAPGGTWGISWFSSGEDCELYSFRDGTLAGSPFPFPEVDIISQVCIDTNYIYVCGSSVEDNEQYIFAYDYAGELMLQLGGEPDGFGLGSITYVTSTENGFLALDGNMREVVLWTADGTWIGAVDDGDLFGTGYPWIAAADVASDGSILIVMSDERPDESADEVLVFRLSGF